jgi:hypothetical protein
MFQGVGGGKLLFEEQHILLGIVVGLCGASGNTLLCNAVGLCGASDNTLYWRFWATHFIGHRSDVGQLHQWVQNNRSGSVGFIISSETAEAKILSQAKSHGNVSRFQN